MLLYNTIIIPAITYRSQLWFKPDAPLKKLVKKLEQVQQKALITISGKFYNTPLEMMQMPRHKGVPPLFRFNLYTHLNFQPKPTCLPTDLTLVQVEDAQTFLQKN